MVEKRNLIPGIIVIMLGILFLLNNTGVINFSLSSLRVYWPVVLILIGLSIIARMRWVAVSFVILLLLLMGLFAVDKVRDKLQESKHYAQDIDLEGADFLDLDITYGAGKLKIDDSDTEFISYDIVSNSMPAVNKVTNSNSSEVDIEKTNVELAFGGSRSEEWDIKIPKDVETDISLTYGATDAEIDLEDLLVKNLEIDSGAADTIIIFGSYPTKARIETGASNIKLRFPRNYGAKVTYDGGLVSTGFRDFVKEGNTFYHNYTENNSIELYISGGLVDITGELY